MGTVTVMVALAVVARAVAMAMAMAVAVPSVEALARGLAREGLGWMAGDVWFFDFDALDETCVDCGNANPSSTYGCPRFARHGGGRAREGGVVARGRDEAAARARAAPPHPSTPRYDAPNIELARDDVVVVDDGARGVLPMSCEWDLAQDEVVLILGRTPEEMRYFALTPYIYDVFTPNTGRFTAFASMGDSFSTGYNANIGAFSRLNTDVWNNIPAGVAARAPTAAWNATFAFIMGANKDTVAGVARALDAVAPGIGKNIFGMQPPIAAATAVTYTMLFRAAVPKNRDAWRAYARNPPLVALRVTPQTMRAPNAFAPTPLIARQTESELPLRPIFNTLVRAVQSYVTSTGRQQVATASAPQMFAADNSATCVQLRINCGGDNRDTNYIRAATFQLNDDNALVYAVGVNHAATGNAYYSNVALYAPSRLLAVLSVNDDEYARSARRWLPNVDTATADLFYVIAFARNCDKVTVPRDTRCVSVPSSGFPSVALDADVVLWERPYSTVFGGAVGPWWQSLIMPTIVESRAMTTLPFMSSF